MRPQRGFSLVELMVVIAIVAILTGIWLSVRNRDYGVNPKQMADELSSVLNFAHSRALTTRKIHQVEVHLELTPPELDIYAAPTVGMSMANYNTPSVPQGVQRIEISNQITLWSAVAGAIGSGSPPGQTTTKYLITYFPDGSAIGSVAGQGATIYVTDPAQAQQYRVLVYHATGSSYARQYW